MPGFAAAWGLHRDVTVLDVREYSLMVVEKDRYRANTAIRMYVVK
jgi:hypothetical protein